MIAEKKVIVQNSQGLHARPAAMFVQLANKFDAEVTVKKEDLEVNGKSIMGIMMLGATKGTEIIIRTKGPDAQRAIDELAKMLQTDIEPEQVKR